MWQVDMGSNLGSRLAPVMFSYTPCLLVMFALNFLNTEQCELGVFYGELWLCRSDGLLLAF